MLHQQRQFYRWLLCLLLVGTTAWTTPLVTTRNHHNNNGVLGSRCGVVFGGGRPIIPSSRATCRLSSSTRLHARFWNNNHETKHRGDHHKTTTTTPKKAHRLAFFRRQVWKRITRFVSALALVFTLMFGQSAAVRPAFAQDELGMSKTPTYSVRPGMTQSEADAALKGMKPAEKTPGERLEGKVTTLFSSVLQEEAPQPKTEKSKTTTSSTKKSKTATQKKKQKTDFDYGYDADFDDADVDNILESKPTDVDEKMKGSKEQSNFTTEKKSLPKNLALKAILVIVVPFFGGLTIYENFRLWREQRDVRRGLAIIKAQEAEYFNITKSDTDDVEIEDELKGLKKNETSTDNDDDDDNEDDDDNDEEEDGPSPKKKPPRGPVGGGDDDDGSSGSGGPSEEDLDRLDKLFNKS